MHTEVVVDGRYVPGDKMEYREQEYFCRNRGCNVRVISRGIPEGWYIIKKSNGLNDRLRTVAILCSHACLAEDAMNGVLDIMRNRY